MDTSSDFIRPEFLNILFFQQRNLVIFPYVDLKHLHGLEIFTAGYNIVDLESTALYNLKEMLEFESTNSYSQNPILYFIYNVHRDKVKELMNLEGIRCVINSNENLSSLANRSSFIFFNKKNNQFLNYNKIDSELEFEKYLITISQDENILQENIQKIKIVATRIFKEINQNGNLENLPDILIEYDKKYWNSILDFTRRYYEINIPDISNIIFKPRKALNDFSDEYDIIISTNKHIGKEFIQLLHEHRSKKVNPSHLELEELYNPQKLYNYLRNHHWKDIIPEDFISAWARMEISGYRLTEQDQADFNLILKKIGIAQVYLPFDQESIENESSGISSTPNIIPSVTNNWDQFKQCLMNHLDQLDYIISNFLNTDPHKLINGRLSDLTSFLIQEISELNDLLKDYLKGNK